MTDDPDPPRPRAPVLIELDDPTPVEPQAAPPVGEPEGPVPAPAMARAMALAARAPGSASGLGGWFWAFLGAFLSFALSVAAWSWVDALIARHPVLGWIGAVLLAAVVVVGLAIAGREILAIRKLARIDHAQRAAAAALSSGSLAQARGVTADLVALYGARAGLAPGLARVRALSPEVLDADGLLRLAEAELLVPLDAEAERIVAGAARQVATVTAVVPLPLADVAVALASNLRMIRAVAEVYGGRSGTLEAWRLVRTVMTHLVATGAVAVGDDLIHGVAGGTILSRLSRRFGEGVVNGALTARVGVAAIEVCRPLPFLAAGRPSVTGILAGALSGLFGRD